MTLNTLHENILGHSVRPVVTYAFTAALIYGFVVSKIPSNMFVPIAISVISYWFGQRERTPTLPVTAATTDTTVTTHAEAAAPDVKPTGA